jgi:hypothetical protein
VLPGLLPDPLLEPLLLPLLEPLLLDEPPPELPPLEPEGQVVPPGSQPVPQLTVWQWYPCPRLVVVQPHDSPRCPAHAFASFPMYTQAEASHVEPPPPPELLPPLPLEPMDPELLPEPPLEPPLDPLDPPPVHATGSHSAGTAAGFHPGSLTCAWMHS